MAKMLETEQVLPFLVVEEHRRRQQQRGQTLLLAPWPPCPTCGKPIEQLTLAGDLPTLDRLMTAHPCGHTRRIPSESLDGVYDWVSRQVDAEENGPAGERPVAPAATIAIYLGSSLPDGDVRQTQIGTVSVDLGPDGINQDDFNRSLGDLLVAAGEHIRSSEHPAIRRVRSLHQHDATDNTCSHCIVYVDYCPQSEPWPCATIRALDGTP